MSPRRMNVAICSAYRAGEDLMRFAAAYPHPISLVATCTKDDTEWEGRIAAIAEARGISVMRRVDANSPEFIAALREREIDLVFLQWWPSIIKADAIAAARVGWVNLHPSLLPYGRGKHGYYWSIVEGTPFGVSMHFVDPGIDTGRVLFQREIPVALTDTGESLYEKSFAACLELWKERYGSMVAGDFEARAQDESRATYHWGKEIAPHSTIDLDRNYRGGELIDILRGRTFWKGDSAGFVKDGKRYRVRIDIEEAGPA